MNYSRTLNLGISRVLSKLLETRLKHRTVRIGKYLLNGRYPESTNLVKMESMKRLKEENKILEQNIRDLVDKLEAKKDGGDVKIPRDLVFKSEELRETTQKLSELDVKEEENHEKVATQCPIKPETATKKQEQNKGNKQKGGGGSKEPPVPDKPIDVSRLDLRIGKIIEVSRHPDADALYVEKIDCGDSSGPRTVISGLVKHIPIEEMKDKSVVVLCNLKPAKMRGILSEAMVMCASTPEKVELIQPPSDVKPGDRVIFDEFPGEPDLILNPKKKIWEQVAPDIKTNDEGVAMYKSSMFKVANVDGQFRSNLKNVQIR